VTPAPVHLHYEFGGHREYSLGFGAAGAVRSILIVPPLFDEMNRVRRMLIEAMRALANVGVRTFIVDMPGCNESVADLSAQTLNIWQDAIDTAARQLRATHIASIRGGCLIDHRPALPHWRLAPAKGASLLKTMLRTRIAAEKENGNTVTFEQLMAAARLQPIELSGNILGIGMLESLDRGEPVFVANLHEVALADVAGTPIWLRAEPQDNPEMSAAIATELDRWSASCGE
jgi:hypothetical protein